MELSARSFDKPDSVEELPLAKAEVVRLGNWSLYRATIQPGWRFSEHAAPDTGPKLCQDEHALFMILSGHFVVKMEDGRTLDLQSGDIASIPPGHDAWVVGEEPVIALEMVPAGATVS